MEDNLRLVLDAIWKVLLIALVMGALMPAVFAVGVRAWATGESAGPDGTVVRTSPRPAGLTVVGVIAFAVVLVAIAYGITYVVATGGGHKVDFGHGYPRIYNA